MSKTINYKLILVLITAIILVAGFIFLAFPQTTKAQAPSGLIIFSQFQTCVNQVVPPGDQNDFLDDFLDPDPDDNFPLSIPGIINEMQEERKGFFGPQWYNLSWSQNFINCLEAQIQVSPSQSSITVVSPAAGASILTGSQFMIAFNASNMSGVDAKAWAYLYPPGAQTGISLGGSQIYPVVDGYNSVSVTTPFNTVPDSGYRVEFKLIDNSTNAIILEEVFSSQFTITSLPAVTAVSTPIQGGTLMSGGTVTVTWATQGVGPGAAVTDISFTTPSQYPTAGPVVLTSPGQVTSVDSGSNSAFLTLPSNLCNGGGYFITVAVTPQSGAGSVFNNSGVFNITGGQDCPLIAVKGELESVGLTPGPVLPAGQGLSSKVRLALGVPSGLSLNEIAGFSFFVTDREGNVLTIFDKYKNPLQNPFVQSSPTVEILVQGPANSQMDIEVQAQILFKVDSLRALRQLERGLATQEAFTLVTGEPVQAVRGASITEEKMIVIGLALEVPAEVPTLVDVTNFARAVTVVADPETGLLHCEAFDGAVWNREKCSSDLVEWTNNKQPFLAWGVTRRGDCVYFSHFEGAGWTPSDTCPDTLQDFAQQQEEERPRGLAGLVRNVVETLIINPVNFVVSVIRDIFQGDPCKQLSRDARDIWRDFVDTPNISTLQKLKSKLMEILGNRECEKCFGQTRVLMGEVDGLLSEYSSGGTAGNVQISYEDIQDLYGYVAKLLKCLGIKPPPPPPPPPPSEDCDCYEYVGRDKRGNPLGDYDYDLATAEFTYAGQGKGLWKKVDCETVDEDLLYTGKGDFQVGNYIEDCPPKLVACEIEVSGEGDITTIIKGVAINELYVANFEGEVFINGISNDTVSVIDTDPSSPTYHKVIKTISVESNPFGVAVDPERRLVYVGSFGTKIYVIDGDPLSPDYHKVIDKIQVPSQVTGISVNSDLNLVYAVHSNDNSVSVIDQDTNTVITTISSNIGTGPFGFGRMVDTKNNQTYVTNWGTGSGNTVSVIDANNVALFSTTPPVIPIPVGTGPIGVAVDSLNDEVYITNSADNSVSIISTISNAVIDTITNIGTGGPTGVAVDSIKRLAYVTNWDAGAGNTVSVIDTNTRAVLKIISNGIGDGPIGVVVDVLHNKIYVTNKEDKVNDPSVTWNVGTVSVIEGDLLSSDYLTVIDIDPTTSVIDKILVGKSPSGIDILSCVPAEKETVCPGVQILVGDLCECPLDMVFDPNVGQCVEIEPLPPVDLCELIQDTDVDVIDNCLTGLVGIQQLPDPSILCESADDVPAAINTICPNISSDLAQAICDADTLSQAVDSMNECLLPPPPPEECDLQESCEDQGGQWIESFTIPGTLGATITIGPGCFIQEQKFCEGMECQWEQQVAGFACLKNP